MDAGIIANSARPYVTGKQRVGHTLTAHLGTWSPTGLTYRYQWFKGTSAINLQTRRTFKLTPGARGHEIRVRVTAIRAGFKRLAKYSPYTSTIH